MDGGFSASWVGEQADEGHEKMRSENQGQKPEKLQADY